MKRYLYKNYWKLGFSTGLYDGFTPLAYVDSIERSLKQLAPEPGDHILDAGCGSGQVLGALADGGYSGWRYVGLDILSAGLLSAKLKSERLRSQCQFIQADLSQPLPLKPNSFSKAIAHFSVYTLPDRESRLTAWRSLHDALKPGGVLVAANPSASYDPKNIIQSSLKLCASRKNALSCLTARLFYYPIASWAGLRYIASQLQTGKWHGYTLEDFQAELTDAGFELLHHESAYGDSGWVVKAKKT